MTFKLSDGLDLEVTEAGEATLTWHDYMGNKTGTIDIDGSGLAVVTKYNSAETTSVLLDMTTNNVLIRPFPLSCDEAGNVLP